MQNLNMSNFFEKLKKGMEIEESVEVKPQPPLKKPVKKIEKTEKEKAKIKQPNQPIEIKVEKVEEPPATPPFFKKERSDEWFEKERDLGGPEGQLTVDVFQTKNDLVIQSAIAGIKSEDLDISIENDVLIIKGNREKSKEEEQDYFTQECYWGLFSRKIILPVEVDPSRIAAIMKQGILTIRLPKIEREKKRKVIVKE